MATKKQEWKRGLAGVLGMRLLYNVVFEGEDIEIIPCSNYRHIGRK